MTFSFLTLTITVLEELDTGHVNVTDDIEVTVLSTAPLPSAAASSEKENEKSGSPRRRHSDGKYTFCGVKTSWSVDFMNLVHCEHGKSGRPVLSGHPVLH